MILSGFSLEEPRKTFRHNWFTSKSRVIANLLRHSISHLLCAYLSRPARLRISSWISSIFPTTSFSLTVFTILFSITILPSIIEVSTLDPFAHWIRLDTGLYKGCHSIKSMRKSMMSAFLPFSIDPVSSSRKRVFAPFIVNISNNVSGGKSVGSSLTSL